MEMLTPPMIKKIRLGLKMTAKKFADTLDVHIDTVFRWERGDRHPTYAKMEEINKLAAQGGLEVSQNQPA
jgi:DNA-binding transcriptional regulator YiaG